MSPIPWCADVSDQGMGDHSGWERCEAIAQTWKTAYGQLYATCLATQERDETQPAHKLSFQRANSLPLVSFSNHIYQPEPGYDSAPHVS